MRLAIFLPLQFSYNREGGHDGSITAAKVKDPEKLPLNILINEFASSASGTNYCAIRVEK